MTSAWWTQVTGPHLAQGDLLSDCIVPEHRISEVGSSAEQVEEFMARARLIVMTQSCDLENEKAPFVALCPIHHLHEFEARNPAFARKGAWENVRKGRLESLHLIASPTNPESNREALVVDFGHIVSLPIDYLKQHAESLGNRWRLGSPFLEHFSQAFARFFMRVGLPSGIPPFQ